MQSKKKDIHTETAVDKGNFPKEVEGREQPWTAPLLCVRYCALLHTSQSKWTTVSWGQGALQYCKVLSL